MIAKRHEELRQEICRQDRRLADAADAIMAGKTAIAEAMQRASARGPVARGVMVVEDHDLHRAMLADVLSFDGIRVVSFSSGIEALRELVLHAMNYGLVVTDISMPSMDGITLAHRIQDIVPGIPVVLVTGSLDGSERERAMRAAGAVAVFGKPLDVGLLQKMVRDILKNSVPVTVGNGR